jgi:isopentenyl phosphate kinase
MVKDLIFIKLGGSAITNKSVENSLNEKVLNQVSKEISECKDFNFLIGHGGGSFAHPIAAKYNVQNGLQGSSLEGYSKTRKAVDDLGEIVTGSLTSAGVPAVFLPTSTLAVMKNGEVKEFFTSPIEKYLETGKVPVLPGDVCLDYEKVFSIASTEMIFNFLASKFNPVKLIIGTNVDGVLDNDIVIPEINHQNFNKVLEKLGGSAGADVTGGMKHKVEELSKTHIDVHIINIQEEGRLKKAILGEDVIGTRLIFK